MKILILGNGYDLAHNLPTSYQDFLKFTNLVKTIYQVSWLKEKDNPEISNKIKNSAFPPFIMNRLLSANQQIQNIDGKYNENKLINSQDSALNEFFRLVENNSWIDYFQHINHVNEWIDFENEIYSELERLSDAIQSKTFSKSYMYGRIKLVDKTDINIIDKLEMDLKNLIQAMEIYFDEFVNHIDITNEIEEIRRFNPDHILSFNYTNTYQRLNKQDCCQIHGTACYKQGFPKKCSLVLGIRKTDIPFANTSVTFFYKEYQREYNENETDYLKWIQHMRQKNTEYSNNYRKYISNLEIFEKEHPKKPYPLPIMALKPKEPEAPMNETMIFGHSLRCDFDILNPFFMLENTNIIIFCKGDSDSKNKWNFICGPNSTIEREHLHIDWRMLND